ncbi:hypothetical protein ACKTEK_11140 [Tepidamorphus sp. 3E244]|uniref:hypothetical protein n=1 Tax=Tepidamorphus sp. 3E244 TaxID=3385498 RepID=UPI0038FCAB08
MLKRLVALSALALTLTAGIAAAATVEAGKVDAYDEATREITLEGGKMFVLADGVSTEGLDVGDEVTLTVNDMDGKMVAEKMEIGE